MKDENATAKMKQKKRNNNNLLHYSHPFEAVPPPLSVPHDFLFHEQ
jgi:hypothetical protein